MLAAGKGVAALMMVISLSWGEERITLPVNVPDSIGIPRESASYTPVMAVLLADSFILKTCSPPAAMTNTVRSFVPTDPAAVM